VKNTHRRTVQFAVTLAVVLALFGRTGIVIAANADAPAVVYPDKWENVSAAFTKQIGADDVAPAPPYNCRCNGLIVTPTGDIVMQTFTKGVCISKDEGATWSVVADNGVKGVCENGFDCAIPYPYAGRMAFFCHDGAEGMSGGMSLDGGKSWSPFFQVNRGVQFADVDWNAREPLMIYGMTHEPYYSVLSVDGGQDWRRLDEHETGSGPEVNYCVGVVNEKTLVRFNPAKGGIIELSNDAAKTWTQVAKYQVLGQRLVHYGKKMYWTTSQGVITSTNGKDWTLTGAGAEGAEFGPYFGSSDQEFVVVTDSYFLKTEDGGKTWWPIAKFYKAPDIFHGMAIYSFFGWDSRHNILYASGVATSVYRLKVTAPIETGPKTYADFAILRDNYGKGTNLQQGDLNHDQVVDYADLALLMPRLTNLTPAQQQEVDAFAKAHRMPIASDAQADVWANVSKTITLPVTDDQGYPLTCQVITPPAYGAVTLTGLTATYTPAPDYSGEDAFTWKANDGKADSEVRTVRLAVNDPAERLPAGDATLDGQVTFADFQVAQANFGKGTKWSQGHFFKGGAVDYRDLVILRAALKDLTPAQEAELTTFLQEHHTPTVENVTGKTRAEQPITMTLHAADDQQPNATYSYRITRKPQHGTAIVSGDTVTYTAQAGFLGTDDFLYQANNGKSDSNQALITVSVLAPITGPSIGVVLDSASPQAKLLEELTLPTITCQDVLAAMSEGGHSVVVTAATPLTLKTLASHPQAVAAFTAKGGWLMLWGLTPDGLADFNRLVGVEHLIRPFTVEAVGLPAHLDSLLNGLYPNTLNMFAGTGMLGIPLRAGDVWSYVLDGDDIAPFTKIPPSDYWRPGVKTGPGSDAYAPNLVNGIDDSWQLGFTIPTNKPEYLKWTFAFPRPEIITQFSLTPDTTYSKIQRIRLTFPGSAAQPLEFAVQPTIVRQDFEIPNIQATGVTLQIILGAQGAAPVTGIRNVWIKVQRSKDFKGKVQPLLSIGVLNKYPMGSGGILVNEMQMNDGEPIVIQRKQERILDVLMHNLLDRPQ
jgi:hypothetical protein